MRTWSSPRIGPQISAASAPRYLELPPGPALAPWVACYWEIRGDRAAGTPNRVMPDGCADLIVGVSGSAEPLVVGTMRTARVVPLSGPVDLFGVRFRPGCARAKARRREGAKARRREGAKALRR